MRNPIFGRLIAAFSVGVVALFCIGSAYAETNNTTNPCVGADPCLILVRHAEKVDSSEDPDLSPAGLARAALLADVLEERGILLTGIHATDYIRTRDTAAPSAEAAGLPVQLYDPSDLEGFAGVAQALSGIHLIVGHSNTTPQLAELLGAPEDSVQMAYDTYNLIVVLAYGEGDDPVLTLLTF